jgi:hypothetical protein
MEGFRLCTLATRPRRCIVEQIAGACRDGTCPAVYLDGDKVVVQGNPVDGAPEGEARVELPPELIKEAAAKL